MAAAAAARGLQEGVPACADSASALCCVHACMHGPGCVVSGGTCQLRRRPQHLCSTAALQRVGVALAAAAPCAAAHAPVIAGRLLRPCHGGSVCSSAQATAVKATPTHCSVGCAHACVGVAGCMHASSGRPQRLPTCVHASQLPSNTHGQPPHIHPSCTSTSAARCWACRMATRTPSLTPCRTSSAAHRAAATAAAAATGQRALTMAPAAQTQRTCHRMPVRMMRWHGFRSPPL
jgi:hypothetical protein